MWYISIGIPSVRSICLHAFYTLINTPLPEISSERLWRRETEPYVTQYELYKSAWELFLHPFRKTCQIVRRWMKVTGTCIRWKMQRKMYGKVVELSSFLSSRMPPRSEIGSRTTTERSPFCAAFARWLAKINFLISNYRKGCCEAEGGFATPGGRARSTGHRGTIPAIFK